MLTWWRRRVRVEAVIDRAYRCWREPPRKASPAGRAITISIVLPVCDPPETALLACLASVQSQLFANWQLCIADDASTNPAIIACLAGLAAQESRIVLRRLPTNQGIAAASNAALSMATGEFVAFLDHDDILAPYALSRLATEIGAHPDTDLVFSDEDQLVGKRRASPYFKPGLNPDLLLAQNAIGHLALYRRTLLASLGGVPTGVDGSQDWALALLATGQATPARIRHVPELLYHWRQTATSFSAAQSDQARQAGQRAVQARLPKGATATPDPALPQWLRITYPLPDPPPVISIILRHPGMAPDDPDYPAVENLTGERNAAARNALGTLLLFVAPGLQAAAPGWLRIMAGQAMRPEVGAVGARLDRPGGLLTQPGRIAQSGLILHPALIAQTLRPASDAGDPGYRGQFGLARSVSAVSLDCLMIRRDVFLAAGGLDVECGAFMDVDLCLRLGGMALRCVWTPYARLEYTKPPRPPRDPESAWFMRARWGERLARDPYLNPNLAVRRGRLALLKPTRTERHLDA